MKKLGRVAASSSTSRKLWLGFGGLSAMLVLSLLLIVVRLSSVEEVVTRNTNALLRDDVAQLLEVNLAAYASVVAEKPSGVPLALRQAAEKAGKINEGIAAYDRLALTERQRGLAAEFQSIWPKLQESGRAILMADRPSDARSQEFDRLRSRLESLLRDRLQPDAAAAFAAVRGSALSQLHDLFLYALMVLALAPLFALGISFIVGRGVLREERTVAEQAELLSVTLASIGDAVITTDTEGCVTNLNPMAEGLTGWSREDAIGQPLKRVFLILDEETREPVENPADISTAGSSRPMLLLAKNGSEHPIDDSVAPMRSARGEIIGCVIVFRDVTKQRLQERELARGRRAESRLAAIVQSSNDAITSRSLEGVIQSWNEGAERIFGYSAEEAIGRHVSLIVPPDKAAENEEILRELLEGKRIGHFDSTRRRKDGTTVPVSIMISPIKDETGAVTGVSNIVRDISERKRYEQTLLDADRRRNEFLATLAHELRNPLAPIRLGLEIMKLAAGDPAKQAKIREMLERQTRQLAALIDDLMDVSRITQGKVELRKQRLVLAEVIRTAVETSQPVIEGLSHELTVTMPPQSIELEADSNRLAQVLSNLLNNAAKFTPRGGRIALAAAASGDEVEICVSDNGIGIAPEAQAKIFEMFAQGGHPLEKSHPGLGIGLTLVKQMVSMHGGSVSVNSDGPGKGSEFRVRLPRLVEAPREPEIIAPEADSSGGIRRILVVDDNEAAAEMLSVLLKDSGHDVRAVYSGAEALQVADEFRPELALVDLGMPGMNGYETAQRLRKQSNGRNLTLVAVTGWGQEEDRRRSKEAGFHGHLVKPLSLEDVQGVLSTLEPNLA